MNQRRHYPDMKQQRIQKQASGLEHIKQHNESAVPEGFSLAMALTDCLPILFFSISSGILKAGWKFTIVLVRKDLPFLNRQIRFLMPAGFSLMLIALFADRSRWSAAAVVRHITAFPSLVFFLAGAAGILLLSRFACRGNGRDARTNWKEQIINGISQLCIMLGILL